MSDMRVGYDPFSLATKKPKEQEADVKKATTSIPRKLRIVSSDDIAIGDHLQRSDDTNDISEVWAVKVWNGCVEVKFADGEHRRYRIDKRHRVFRNADRRRR